MKNSGINLGSLGTAVSGALKRLRAYSGIGFFLVIAALYGFILWRINAYSNTPAAQGTANAAVQPHINPEVAQKMLDLQNNSVNVQTLFNEARQNPFQE